MGPESVMIDISYIDLNSQAETKRGNEQHVHQSRTAAGTCNCHLTITSKLGVIGSIVESNLWLLISAYNTFTQIRVGFRAYNL